MFDPIRKGSPSLTLSDWPQEDTPASGALPSDVEKTGSCGRGFGSPGRWLGQVRGLGCGMGGVRTGSRTPRARRRGPLPLCFDLSTRRPQIGQFPVEWGPVDCAT